MYCVTSAVNCVNDSQFTVSPDPDTCKINVLLDSSDAKVAHMLIEARERKSLTPLIASFLLITVGMLVGLKGAQSR